MTNFVKQRKKLEIKPNERIERANLSISATSNNSKNNEKFKSGPCYPNYISMEEVMDGLKTGRLTKGILRINPKFTRHSFVDNEDPSKPNHLLTSFISRNRALDRDEVILQIDENADEQNETQVVFIWRKVHARVAVGYLKPIENNTNIALFSPRDRRVPKMSIHKSQWPKNFDTRPEHFENILCVAQISKWVKIKQAQGRLIEILGKSGNLKSESLAILREFCIDCENYGTNVTSRTVLLSSPLRMELPREDLRTKCVFTIDNPDTKDMDDALSCHELSNGNYEIGVHISDVSHYLKERTMLDEVVKSKATSVYLVGASYNMLPDDLSSLCSLEANREKLTFSIFWEMTPDGIILRNRGAKSVINSSAKLSYTHAQMFLDSPDRIFDRGELPPIYHGFTSQDLSKAINNLQKIALFFRERRRRNCGVRQTRSCTVFRLDHVTGEPVGLVSEERIPSQELVEEFMILTNYTVAERIYRDFPDRAILRMHGPPNSTKITQLQKHLRSLGIHIEVSSSKEIQDSINKYNTSEILNVVLNRLIGKCMQKQKYVYRGSVKNASLQHFGLGFSKYAHFTSPMRRYADVITHRLLATSLKYRNDFRLNVNEVADIVDICNQQEFRAKKAAEASFDLYLGYFIEGHQPFIQKAVVYNVKEESFDVVVFSTGSSLRVYANTFDENWKWKSEKVVAGDAKPTWKMYITFPENRLESEKSLVVDIFTVVKVELTKSPKLNRLKAKLCKP